MGSSTWKETPKKKKARTEMFLHLRGLRFSAPASGTSSVLAECLKESKEVKQQRQQQQRCSGATGSTAPACFWDKVVLVPTNI